MELANPCPPNDLQSIPPVVSESEDNSEFMDLNWDEKGLLSEPIFGYQKLPGDPEFHRKKQTLDQIPEQSYYHVELFPDQAFEELQTVNSLVSEKEFVELPINSVPQLVEHLFPKNCPCLWELDYLDSGRDGGKWVHQMP